MNLFYFIFLINIRLRFYFVFCVVISSIFGLSSFYRCGVVRHCFIDVMLLVILFLLGLGIHKTHN